MHILPLFLPLACSLGGGDDRDGDGVDGLNDCNDFDPVVYPGGPELCDGVDQDCDDVVDEQATDAALWYVDEDNDGHGDPATEALLCEAPRQGVLVGDDCDDANPLTHPGADERCDGLDQDCDAVVDEAAVDADTWFVDGDGDGHGDPDAPLLDCGQPAGAARSADDCDDGEPLAWTGADEVCGDGVDNDCDGTPGDCALSGDVELDRAWLWVGEAGGEDAGASLALSDLDGDGGTDLVVGGPGHSPGLVSLGAGAVWRVPGPVTGSGELARSPLWEGTAFGQACGTSLVAPGDVTGDGVADLWVGAPGTNTLAGAALLVDGPWTGSGGDLGARAMVTGASGQELGTHLAGGVDIVAVGGRGVVHVVPSGGGVDRASLTGSGTLAVAVDDLDGDGVADVVVGDVAEGSVRLLLDPTGVLGDFYDVRWSGSGAGAAVAAGDLDGDGAPEVLVGAPLASSGGQVRALSAQAASLEAWLVELRGEPGDELGTTVGVVGDVGRGVVSWAAGGAEAVLLVDGHRTGGLEARDAELQLLGELPGAVAGGSVTGDAVGDVVVGLPTLDGVGAAAVVQGLGL